MFKKLATITIALGILMLGGCSKGETNTDLKVNDNTENIIEEAPAWSFSQVAMGGGGFVSGVFATKEDGLYYARTDVGGAYRFNKDTEKWESMSYGINEDDRGFLGIAGLAFAENEPNKVFLLAGTNYFSGGRTALLISSDYGRTFSRTELTDLILVNGNGMGRGNGERLAVDPKNSNVIYAGGMSTGGLIKSTDGGLTFTKLDLGTDTSTENQNGICSILIDPESGDENGCTTIYAAISRKGDYNIYKTTDAGATWNPVESAPQGLMVQRMKYNGNGKIVITYADAEGPWNNNRISGGIRMLNISDDSFTDISPAKKGFGDVVIDPENPDRMAACTENIYVQQPNGSFGDEFYVTTDGGQSWKMINDVMSMTDGGVKWQSTTSMHWCSSMCIDPNNTDKVMVVSGNGIFACDNIWDEKPEFYFCAQGIEETVPYELVSIPGGELVTVVADYDGFTQNDAAEFGNVHNSIGGSMTGLAVAAANTDVWVKCGGNDSYNGFWYTENRGETWTHVENSPMESKNAYGGSVAVSADGSTFYWAPENGAYIFYTKDKGENWTQSEGGLNSNRIIADPVNSDYVYAASSSAFYYSSDGGKTFTANNEVAVFTSKRPIVVPGVEGKIYYPAMGLQVSEDHGKTFTRIDTVSNCQAVGLGRGKNEGDPCTIIIWGHPTSEDPVGLYWSEDEGKTWSRINDSEHEFGGIGNGSFVYGDFNVYGRVYMSTVGLGVICADFNGN
ncbi:MAG: WD40/YVTN/BNR-like repeat-containing protein [Oscillospiraceae bacterium]